MTGRPFTRKLRALGIAACLLLVVGAGLTVWAVASVGGFGAVVHQGPVAVAVRVYSRWFGPPEVPSGFIPKCTSNVQNIHLGLSMYAMDHQGALPDSLDALRNYFVGGEVPACPDAGADGDAAPGGGYEYAGAGLRLADITSPAAVPLVFDSANRHWDGRNVGFADGSVRWMEERDFRQALSEAIGSGAYPPKTVEALKREEPWLVEQAGDWQDRKPQQ